MGLSRKFANLGKALDSGVSGDFLTVGDSGGLFRDIEWTEIAGKPSYVDSAATTALIDSAYVQARQTDVGLDSGMITNLVDSAYVQLRQGEIGLDSAQVIAIIDSAYVTARTPAALDSGGVTGLIDSNYVTNRVTANSGFKNYRYTATSGQTTFDSTDVNGSTLTYSEDGILVFYNGVVLEKTIDYTASNGTSVVLTEAADSGVSVNIATWTLSSSSSSASSFAWGGDRVLVSDTSLAQVDYYDMTTTTNAADFGDLTNPSSNPYAALSDNSRAIFAATNYEYFTIATTGNATAFGNRTSVVDRGQAGLSDGTYGLFAGGYGTPSYQSSIEYITIQSTGNGSDFGDMTVARGYAGAAGGTTRGVIGAGFNTDPSPTYSNVIDYVTFASPGNATDFGDLTLGRGFAAGLSDETTAVFAGGTTTSYSNVMDYITVDTTSNAQDFGDLIAEAGSICGGTSNNTRGTWNGGYDNGSNPTNIVQYITVASPGNATDLLDLTQAATRGGSAAGNAS